MMSLIVGLTAIFIIIGFVLHWFAIRNDDFTYTYARKLQKLKKFVLVMYCFVIVIILISSLPVRSNEIDEKNEITPDEILTGNYKKLLESQREKILICEKIIVVDGKIMCVDKNSCVTLTECYE